RDLFCVHYYLYSMSILGFIITLFIRPSIEWPIYYVIYKAFDRVPREVLWWALRHVGVEEWMVNVIKSLYEGVTTAVRRNGEESESFEVKVGVHQRSVLSSILFNIVMQAIADNLKKDLPWLLLYADD